MTDDLKLAVKMIGLKQKGLTYKKLSEITGLDVHSISDAISGKRQAWRSTIKKLNDAIDDFKKQKGLE